MQHNINYFQFYYKKLECHYHFISGSLKESPGNNNNIPQMHPIFLLKKQISHKSKGLLVVSLLHLEAKREAVVEMGRKSIEVKATQASLRLK